MAFSLHVLGTKPNKPYPKTIAMKALTEPMPTKHYKQFANACFRYKTRMTEQARELFFFEVSTDKGRVWNELRGDI